MNADRHGNSRRDFLPKRGATDPHADRDQIRQIHTAFTGRLEAQAYESAVDLFIEEAHLNLDGNAVEGIAAIRRLLSDQYRHQRAATQHSAYRPNGLQCEDSLTIGEDLVTASATWHVGVRICSPLQGDSNPAAMAQLQGRMGEVHWEAGLIEARYVKSDGRWKIQALDYFTA